MRDRGRDDKLGSQPGRANRSLDQRHLARSARPGSSNLYAKEKNCAIARHGINHVHLVFRMLMEIYHAICDDPVFFRPRWVQPTTATSF